MNSRENTGSLNGRKDVILTPVSPVHSYETCSVAFWSQETSRMSKYMIVCVVWPIER